MKLIADLITEEINFFTEEKEDGIKEHYIEGIFLQSNIKNRNGRIYPKSVLENEVNRYTKEMVNNNRAWGELNHPAGPTINLDRVSHIITEIKQDGDDFHGKAKIIDTPMGNIVKGLLKSGGKLGVSSRGMGSLKPIKEGLMEVQNDYHIATAADIVSDPSAPKAFINGIMEGVEFFYDSSTDSWLMEKTEVLRKSLNKMNIKEIEEKRLVIFEDYIANLTVKLR